MAVYDYRCDMCQEEFEVHRPMSDENPEECPHCGSVYTRKMVSDNNGFILSGQGWYKKGGY